MAISILIKADGEPPREITGLSGFMLITVPIKNPDKDTNFVAGGLQPKAIAECGAFAIRMAKHMVDGEKLTPLGQPMSAAESRIIKPRSGSL